MQFKQIFIFTMFFVIVSSRNATTTGPSHGKTIVCTIFIQSEAEERLIPFKFDEIDWNLCTHILYMDKKGQMPWDLKKEVLGRDYKQIKDLRIKYPHLKVYTGFRRTLDNFLDIFPIHEITKKIQSYVKDHGFDGFNFHIDINENRRDMTHIFDILLLHLKKKFDQSNLSIAFTINIPENFNATICNLAPLTKSVDFINVMHNLETDEMLYTRDNAFKLLGFQSFQHNIKQLIDSGVSPSKIIAGIRFGGPLFKSTILSKYGTFEGMIPYNKICMRDEKENWKKSGSFKEPELTVLTGSGNYNLVIENSRSIANKVRFAMKRGLAGVATIHVPYDDINGNCDIDQDTFEDFIPASDITLNFPKRIDKTLPLLRTINEAIDVTLDEVAQEYKTFKINSTTNANTNTNTTTTTISTNTTDTMQDTSIVPEFEIDYDPDSKEQEEIDSQVIVVEAPQNQDPSTGATFHFESTTHCLLVLTSAFILSIVYN